MGLFMNINIYLEDSLGHDLNVRAKQIGKSRNAIIREAIKEWVKSHRSDRWPRTILNFSGIHDAVTFESYRKDLLASDKDPFE